MELVRIPGVQENGYRQVLQQRVRCIPYVLFSCGIGAHVADSMACLIAAAEKFYDSWPIIPILILAFLFNVFAGFYGTVFTASMKTRHLMTSTAAAAIVVIVLTWLLIRVMGLQGAAWAMVGSNLVMYAIRVVMANQIVKINVNRPLMLANILLVSVQTCVLAWHPTAYTLVSAVLFLAVLVVSAIDIYPSVKTLSVAVQGKGSRNNHGKHVREMKI